VVGSQLSILIVERKRKRSTSFNLLPMLTVPTLKEYIWEELTSIIQKHSFTHLQGKDLGGGAMKKFRCGIGWDQLVIYNTG
jgi:hypothetical protein